MYHDDGIDMSATTAHHMGELAVSKSNFHAPDFGADGITYDLAESVLPGHDGFDDLNANMMGGNGEDLLMYPDPLAYANEFAPDNFYLDDVQADALASVQSITDMPEEVSYTMAMDGGLMPSWNNVNEFPGVENGILSDPSQLDALINLGELQETMHINADDVVRSEDAKQAFLHAHGYTDLPPGYELHHIVPLSQGGADDQHNMVLLTEAQHDAVTNAHRQYYGW